jgi:CheY-like chemotaxis protein
MGGEIGVKSRPHIGSTFFFTVIFKKDLSASEETLSAQTRAKLDQLRVLIIDDNKNNRFVFSEYLKSWHCIPVEAKSGQEALSILRNQISAGSKTDMILSDFQIPGMDGFRLAGEIRKMESLNNIPIVLLTSVGMPGDSKICKELGINGYLTKPVKRNDLKSAIISILNKEDFGSSQNSSGPLTRHTISEIKRAKMQILLAEDYPTNQQIAVKHLTDSGFQVSLAENGRQAVDLFKTKQFDLILMDIQMPMVDGYEATRMIRELEKTAAKIVAENNPQSPITVKRTPIIALTAHAIKGYREKCLDADMDDYLTKPYKKKDMIDMVEKWGLKKTGQTTGSGVKNSLDIQHPSLQDDTLFILPLDYDQALDEFGNDPEFFKDVLLEFIRMAAQQLKRIDEAFIRQDFAVIQSEAHAIKGGASNLTAMPLSNAAAELESVSKTKAEPLSFVDLIKNLDTEFKRLKQFSEDLFSAQQ